VATWPLTMRRHRKTNKGHGQETRPCCETRGDVDTKLSRCGTSGHSESRVATGTSGNQHPLPVPC
jgi:hypothetical protein